MHFSCKRLKVSSLWLQSQRDAHQPGGAERHPRGRQDPGDQRPTSWDHDGGGGTIRIIIFIIIIYHH